MRPGMIKALDTRDPPKGYNLNRLVEMATVGYIFDQMLQLAAKMSEGQESVEADVWRKPFDKDYRAKQEAINMLLGVKMTDENIRLKLMAEFILARLK